VEPVQAIALPKASNILDRIEGFGAFLANSDEFPHSFRLLVALAEVTLANRLPDEFRDGSLSTPRLSVKGAPETIIQV